MRSALTETLTMIKIEHSIFALPFATLAAFWAAGGLPEWRVLTLIVAAMVTARSAAMAFNRYLDAGFDAENPRTAGRAIPAGRLSERFALGFTIACALLFVAVCAAINTAVLWCSPLFLTVLLGYSATKRFTRASHLVLGLALGLAPIGAWLAVRGSLSAEPVLLGLAVVSWVAGFDIIYSCQDAAFDRERGLFSLPATLGVGRALAVARLAHGLMVALLTLIGSLWLGSSVYWIGVFLVIGCLAWEHGLVHEDDLSRVDAAFFTLNGIVSLVFGAFAIAAVYLVG